MSGSMLRLLQDSLRANGLNRCRYLLRLVSHDHNYLLCVQRQTGADGVLDKWPPSRTVQYLREAGLQPCALAGSEDNDS